MFPSFRGGGSGSPFHAMFVSANLPLVSPVLAAGIMDSSLGKASSVFKNSSCFGSLLVISQHTAVDRERSWSARTLLTDKE